MLDKTFHLSESHLHNERVELDGFKSLREAELLLLHKNLIIIPTIRTDKNTFFLVSLCGYLLGITDLICV